MGQEFSWWVTLRKVFGSGVVAVMIVVVAIQSVPVPEDANAWADWKPWAMAVAAAILRGVANLIKTSGLPGNPIAKIAPMLIVGMLAASMTAGAMGCATLTPVGDGIQAQRDRLAQYESYLMTALLVLDAWEDWQASRGELSPEQAANLDAARRAVSYWRERVNAMRAALDYEPLPEGPPAVALKALGYDEGYDEVKGG